MTKVAVHLHLRPLIRIKVSVALFFMFSWLPCIIHATSHETLQPDSLTTKSFSDLDSIREMPVSALDAPMAAPDNDTTLTPVEFSRSKDANWWWNRLRQGTLVMSDTTIIYPHFLKFCVNVYNWADRAFNYYDKDYVQGTGRRWKARLANDNWLDSYAMNFKSNVPIWMLSEPYCNLGFYLQYMAISVGYAIDMSHVIGNKPLLHKRFEFAFTCARFYAEGYYSENTGGTYLRRFGDYNNGKIFKKYIPGVTFHSKGINAYYFFNHSRYSQGCVYGYSNLQKRSAGSIIAGISISNHDINVDFATLPENMLQYLKSEDTKYRFYFNDYSLLIGYGYNLAFARNFVFNVTALPAFGYKHCFRQCTGGKRDMWSLNVIGRLGLVYNYRDFFAGLNAKMEGHWFRGSNYNFFNSIETVSLVTGVRF